MREVIVACKFLAGCLYSASTVTRQRLNSKGNVCTQITRLLAGVFNRDVFRVWIVIQASPARASVAATRWSRISPDPPVLVTLVEAISCSNDFPCIGVVVQSLPAWAAISTAGRSRVAPDPAIVVQLIQHSSARSDRDSLGIIVQQLPTGTGIAVARFASVTPDAPIVV